MAIFVPQVHPLKSGEEVVVRSALPDDAAAVLAHARSIIEEGEFSVSTPEEFVLTIEQECDWIRMHAEDPGRLLIVAEHDGRIVGLLGLESGARRRLAHRATLHMSVDRDWRGRGVGTVLLQEAIDWCARHPTIEKLALAVLSTNTRAIGLYRKLGFVEEGRRPREIKLAPGRYVDDVQMYRYVNNDRLFHITTVDEWEAAGRLGDYVPTAFSRDGFIHCSYVGQVVAVANFLFHGRTDLVLLEIDRSGLDCPVVDENLEGGEQQFPHIYGRLPISAVMAIHDFPCGKDGTFQLPNS